MLSIKNLNKSYNGRKLFQDFCLDLKGKSIVGLTGPSGSGKSTLLRCIQGLETIDSGIINFNHRVGFVFQDFQLFPHFTVLENIIYAPTKVLKKPVNLAKKEARSWLQQLSILEHQNHYPKELSGGQKQKVAIVRALVMDPELLLCDEPTSGLDLGAIASLKEVLKSLNNMGVGILVSSHDINFLVAVCARIIVIKKGKVVNDLIHFDPKDSIKNLQSILL